jgi:hypothetical protein
MDFRPPKRSSSHGSLYRSPRGHGTNHGQPLHHIASQNIHRPASRHVERPTAFLPPLGPLLGMLKTTSETRDIGFFSISTVRSFSPAAPWMGEPTRCHTADGESLPARSRAMRQRSLVRDDARRVRSGRDTESEILSLYCSDGQRSHKSASSIPEVDCDPRLCSPGSGHSGRVYNRGGFLSPDNISRESQRQRPRSPYPYPTRLKRPGFRTVSPAITEGGLVDYSRMVEIDRVSAVRTESLLPPRRN